MVKKTFTRRELVHNGIVNIRTCYLKFDPSTKYFYKMAFDIAGDLFQLGIIPFDKYDLLMDIIERKFGMK